MTSETEHLERAYEIWRQFRFYLIAGLLLVLTAIFGFTHQNTSFDKKREDQNQILYAALTGADNDDIEAALSQYENLKADGDFSDLSHLVAFAVASLAVSDEHKAEAKTMLQDVIDSSEDNGLVELAALRLAEMLINEGEYQEAVDLLENNTPAGGRLTVLFYERIGDAEYGRGDLDAAAAGYEQAVEYARENASFYMPVLSIKIGSLLSELSTDES